jgi:hypothetical protein
LSSVIAIPIGGYGFGSAPGQLLTEYFLYTFLLLFVVQGMLVFVKGIGTSYMAIGTLVQVRNKNRASLLWVAIS